MKILKRTTVIFGCALSMYTAAHASETNLQEEAEIIATYAQQGQQLLADLGIKIQEKTVLLHNMDEILSGDREEEFKNVYEHLDAQRETMREALADLRIKKYASLEAIAHLFTEIDKSRKQEQKVNTRKNLLKQRLKKNHPDSK